MNLWLVGMMGSGKSTVGRLAAHRVGVGFIDTDDQIELVASETIAGIWGRSGEQEFRAIESDVVGAAAESDGMIIATGGGAILDAENRAIISSTGTVLWMQATPAVSLSRLPAAADRPLLSTGDELETLARLLDERHSLYASISDYQVDTSELTLDQCVQAVVDVWSR